MSAVVKGKTNQMSGWPIVRLDSVCEIQLGKMLSPAARVGTSPLPYLRNQNVQWGRFDLADVARMDFDERQQQKFALRAGDLLVCEGGEPGRAAVWDGSIEPCFYQKALHRLRPKNDQVDPHFLMYRLWFSAMNGEFVDSHGKTTIAHLPADRLSALQIALPPLREQRRIAALLKEKMAAADAALAKLEEQIALTQGLGPAYLRKAFAGEL